VNDWLDHDYIARHTVGYEALVERVRQYSPDAVCERVGLATEEIERVITIPLENELNGIANITILKSESQLGLSNIRIVFGDGAGQGLVSRLAEPVRTQRRQSPER